MSTVDLSPEKNPARYPAMRHAAQRAKRENCAMAVYVGPPECGGIFTTESNRGYNVWFVRKYAEPAPEGAQRFLTVFPEAENALTSL